MGLDCNQSNPILSTMARILFIDDDEYTLRLMEKASALLGHEAVLTSSAAAALGILLSESPDLVIADLNLPDLDGISFLQQLETALQGRTPPVVILSAGVPEEDESIALAAGAREYLSKPITLEILSLMIEKYSRYPE